MDAVAELVPGVWEPLDDKSGYRLVMDSHAVAQRDKWWRLFLGEREAALQALRRSALEQMNEEPYRRKPGDPDPERSDPQIEDETADQQDFFRALPKAMQERIVERLAETPFYRTVVGFDGADDEGATVMPLSDLPSNAQKNLRRRAATVLGVQAVELPSDGAVVTCVFGGFVLSCGVTFGEGRSTNNSVMLRRFRLSDDSAVLSLDQRALVEAVNRLGRTAPEGWKQLATFESAHFWPNEASPLRVTQIPPRRRAEVLQWLGDKGNIEFIADYYSRAGTAMLAAERTQPLKRPLKEELDYRALEQDMSWKKRPDSLYLFRNNRWYRDDYLELPSAMAEKWLALPLFAEKLPGNEESQAVSATEQLRRQMDWEADVVTNLSRWQIGNGLKWYAKEPSPSKEQSVRPAQPAMPYPFDLFRFFTDSDRLMLEYNTARFYASLDSIQRQAVIEKRLQVRSLSPQQREAALSLVPSLAVRLGAVDVGNFVLGLNPTNERSLQMGRRTRVRLKEVSTSPMQSEPGSPWSMRSNAVVGRRTISPLQHSIPRVAETPVAAGLGPSAAE